jgi:hypothetical protein
LIRKPGLEDIEGFFAVDQFAPAGLFQPHSDLSADRF